MKANIQQGGWWHVAIWAERQPTSRNLLGKHCSGIAGSSLSARVLIRLLFTVGAARWFRSVGAECSLCWRPPQWLPVITLILHFLSVLSWPHSCQWLQTRDTTQYFENTQERKLVTFAWEQKNTAYLYPHEAFSEVKSRNKRCMVIQSVCELSLFT